jgi:hypothetical protein
MDPIELKMEFGVTITGFPDEEQYVPYNYHEMGMFRVGSGAREITSKSLFYDDPKGGKVIFTYHSAHHIRHHYCIIAIRNLLKKENYRDLLEEFTNKEITFEVFREELEKNHQKYTIELQENFFDGDIDLIMQIMKDIGEDIRDLSISDVSEMFSLPQNYYSRFIK